MRPQLGFWGNSLLQKGDLYHPSSEWCKGLDVEFYSNLNVSISPNLWLKATVLYH